MKKLVYIGNNLQQKNPTTMVLLTNLFKKATFQVSVYSNKQHKLARLWDMCVGVFRNRNTDYVLIDTYSTVNFYYALLVSQLARLLSIPYIPILHGGNLPNRLEKNPRLCRILFKHAFVNVAPSNYLLNAFIKAHFKTRLIPNAIVIKQYPYKERLMMQPHLLWVRAFDTIYNPEMAIHVLAELIQLYPHAKLCMVGPEKDGSLEICKALATQLNVLDAIEFTGLLTKDAWLRKSQEFDIFINTTTIDNTPVSVIEAMALGLTVVSTNVGGVPFLIEDGVDGLLVENADVQNMVKKVQFIIEEQPQYLAKNAREKVVDFDEEKVIEQWIQLLK